jgi:DNA modification methylase
VSAPYYQDDAVTLWHGDCIDVLRELPDASVDAVVTDPPYGLEFMGKAWDSFGADVRQRDDATFTKGDTRHGTVRFGLGQSYGGDTGRSMRAFQAWCEEWAAECLRVLKPGGHLLAFGGTRTWHRLACAIEDAGFEVRDSIAWLYGSGFPKSLDVSKAIDKAAGAERASLGIVKGAASSATESLGVFAPEYHATAPATDDARRWQGWGTALKPAHEPVVVARKPLDGTVAANVLRHGTGALNIDGCRISANGERFGGGATGTSGFVDGYERGDGFVEGNPAGRWPANVILDGAHAAELDRQAPNTGAAAPASGPTYSGPSKSDSMAGAFRGNGDAPPVFHGDTGGASRFFYVAKAPTAERPREGDTAHPTVKPLDLMRHLVRLVTPPGGVVLEPFAGSGTTAEACVIEGFRCIAIEREADYLPLIVQRLTKPIQPDLFGGVA